MVPSAQVAAGKWVRGMQNAGESMKAGIQAVTVAPGQIAASRADLYRRKVIEAVDSGRYQAATAAVSLQEWQQAALTKGVSAATSRAEGSREKVTKFLNFWLPITQQASQLVQGMAKGTLEDSKARMIANVEFLAGKKYKGR